MTYGMSSRWPFLSSSTWRSITGGDDGHREDAPHFRTKIPIETKPKL